MKKKLTIEIILTVLIAVTLIPTVILAADPAIKTLLNEAAGEQGAGYATDARLAETGVAEIVGWAARIAVSLVGVIFISYTIYGGFLWMTAGGNEDKIDKAKKIIQNGIIGLVLIVGAAGIYLFIRNAFFNF